MVDGYRIQSGGLIFGLDVLSTIPFVLFVRKEIFFNKSKKMKSYE